MTRERFEKITQSAFDNLPERFRNSIENVHIVVEDYPSEDLTKRQGYGKYSLLGLYQGIPLTRRGTWYGASPTVPDKISLYKGNIEASCTSEEEVGKKIAEVLFHEIGHYFGMNEKEIRSAMKDFS